MFLPKSRNTGRFRVNLQESGAGSQREDPGNRGTLREDRDG